MLGGEIYVSSICVSRRRSRDHNSMNLIKELREKTGAGISDCKKALEEAGNDLEKAVEILRKKGIAKAAKRSDRETGEGVIKVSTSDDNKIGFILEVNAETDFVIRSERFQNFAEQVLALAKENKPQDKDGLMALPLDGMTVKESLDNLSGVIGEKLDIKRYEILPASGTVVGYSHMGGKIGVLVALDKEGQADLARDIAMQVAAANPKYLDPSQVPAEELNKEKEIYAEQLKKEGKPENIIEKIMEGKINKYYEEVCLIKQEYIKDDKKRVEQVLGDVKVEKFIRYSI